MHEFHFGKNPLSLPARQIKQDGIVNLVAIEKTPGGCSGLLAVIAF